MTDEAMPESAPAPGDPPTKGDELTEQQLEGVTGAAGRQVDCEGYSYMSESVLASKTTPALKSE